MRNLLVGMLLMLALIVGGLAYIGVIPVLSPMLQKAKDLEVKVDPALSQMSKTTSITNQIEGGQLKPGTDGVFEGARAVSDELDSSLVSSVFAYWQTLNPSLPIRNVQVKFTGDMGEVSGYFDLGSAITLAQGLGYSAEQIDKAKSYATIVNNQLPFYVKGSGLVTNGQFSLKPQTFELGRLTVPEAITNLASGAVEDIAEKTISRIAGASVSSATIKDSKLNFVGTIPETIK